MLTLVVTATLVQGVPAPAFAFDDLAEPSDAEVFDNQLHAANLSLNNPHHYRDLILGLVLSAQSKTAPNRPEAEVAGEFQELSGYLDERLKDVGKSPFESKALVLSKVNTAIAGNPKLAPAAVALKETLTKFAQTPGRQYDNWQNAVAANRYLNDSAATTLDALNVKAAGRVREMGALFEANNAYVKTWDEMVGADSGATAKATTDQLIEKSPLKEVLDFSSVGKYQKDDPLYKEEILKQFKSLVSMTSGHIDTAVLTIDGLQLSYNGALWSSTGPTPEKQAIEAAVKAAEERQGKIDKIGKAFNLVTSLLGKVDPGLARKVKGVGEAAITIATAINKYLPTIVGKGFVDAIFSAGTQALTGSIIGAISGLLPLFQAAQPSPEQMILEQIGKLREEVANLHKAMDEQFGRVNENLNVIYKDMLGKFDEVMKLQQASIAQLTEIQGRLQSLQQSVDVWAGEIIRSLQTGGLQQARSQMNKYIGYEATNGTPIPTAGEYIGVTNDLHFAAVTQANAEPFVPSPEGYQQHSGNPVAVIDTYAASGGATGFLNWYGNRTYGWPSEVSKAPNLAAWLTMASGYTQLMTENQNYAKNISVQRTSDIVAEGLKIDKAAQNLSKPATPQAPGDPYTNKLFTRLVGDYKQAAGNLSAQLAPFQKEAVDSKGYKLFGTPDQALPAGKTPPTPEVNSRCTPGQFGEPRDLQTPTVLTLSQLPNAILMANYAFPEADRPALTICNEARVVNRKTTVTPDLLETTTAELSVAFKMQLKWPNNTVETYRTWSATLPLGTVCLRRLSMPIPGDQTVYFCNQDKYYFDNWAQKGYKQAFEAAATATATDDAVLASTRTKVTQFLYGRQKSYYDTVVSELTNVSKPLYSANAAMTKSMRLLRAYTETGWATASRTDEIMNLLLYGVERLPSDIGDDTMIIDIFRQAQQNYAECKPAGGPGSACTGTASFDPLVGQYQEWLRDCLTWYDKTPLPADLWTADPLGNTLLGFSRHAADVLQSRYELHSKELADGKYTEGVPEVKDMMKMLESIDAVIRVPAP